MFSKVLSLAAIAASSVYAAEDACGGDIVVNLDFGSNNGSKDSDCACADKPAEEETTPAEPEEPEHETCILCQTTAVYQCTNAIEAYQTEVVTQAEALRDDLDALFTLLRRTYPLFKKDGQTQQDFNEAIRSLFTTAVLEGKAVITPVFPTLINVDCQCRSQTESLRNELENIVNAIAAITAEQTFLETQLCADLPSLVSALTTGAEASLATATGLVSSLEEDIDDLDVFQGVTKTTLVPPNFNSSYLQGIYAAAIADDFSGDYSADFAQTEFGVTTAEELTFPYTACAGLAGDIAAYDTARQAAIDKLNYAAWLEQSLISERATLAED